MKSPPAIQPPNPGRVVGLDIHPDSFAAAILEGRDPLKARVSESVTHAPLPSLERWIGRHAIPTITGAGDAAGSQQSAGGSGAKTNCRPLARDKRAMERDGRTMQEPAKKLDKRTPELGVAMLNELGYASKEDFLWATLRTQACYTAAASRAGMRNRSCVQDETVKG